MFTVQAAPTFKADVEVPLPDGKVATIKAVFKHKGRKALAEYLKTFTAEDAAKGEVARDDADAIMEILDSWSNVDQALTKESLEAVLDNYPTAAKAFFDAYLPALTEGKAKNSGKP